MFSMTWTVEFLVFETEYPGMESQDLDLSTDASANWMASSWPRAIASRDVVIVHNASAVHIAVKDIVSTVDPFPMIISMSLTSATQFEIQMDSDVCIMLLIDVCVTVLLAIDRLFPISVTEK